MSEESREAELKDVLDLLVAEDEDLERRSLDRVVSQQVLQQFQSILGLELLFQHPVEYKVEDSKHRRYLLVAILMFLAERVVHVVKVQLEKFDFARRFVWCDIDD